MLLYVSAVPFTACHPAAVLPVLRTGLPASALVIGSMAPDVPYYLPVSSGSQTHTAAGVVTVDLLLGGACWLVWHGLLAAPALVAAPVALQRRLEGRVETGLAVRLASARRAGLVLLALAVGAGTHVLWDEFTHVGGWGTQHLPVLAEQWLDLPGYRWAQYASTVLGGLTLLAWYLRWWHRTPQARRADGPRGWWPWLVLATAGTAVGAVAAARSDGSREAAFQAATRGGAAVAVTAVLLAAGWQLTRLRLRSGARPR